MRKSNFSKLFFLLFMAIAFTFAACNKEKVTSDNNAQDMEYKFSKQFALEDAQGNSALVVISSNDKNRFDQINSEQLELVTYTSLPAANDLPTNGATVDESAELDFTGDNIVFVDAVEHNLSSEIVGFWVKVNMEVALEGAAEQRWDHTDIAYGADGVNGAKVTYVTEDCSNNSRARLRYDLDKKSSSEIFWKDLVNGLIERAGTTYYLHCGRKWNRFRIRLDGERCGGGRQAASCVWLKGC